MTARILDAQGDEPGPKRQRIINEGNRVQVAVLGQEDPEHPKNQREIDIVNLFKVLLWVFFSVILMVDVYFPCFSHGFPSVILMVDVVFSLSFLWFF